MRLRNSASASGHDSRIFKLRNPVRTFDQSCNRESIERTSSPGFANQDDRERIETALHDVVKHDARQVGNDFDARRRRGTNEFVRYHGVGAKQRLDKEFLLLALELLRSKPLQRRSVVAVLFFVVER
jgi:hypothetical protein